MMTKSEEKALQNPPELWELRYVAALIRAPGLVAHEDKHAVWRQLRNDDLRLVAAAVRGGRSSSDALAQAEASTLRALESTALPASWDVLVVAFRSVCSVLQLRYFDEELQELAAKIANSASAPESGLSQATKDLLAASQRLREERIMILDDMRVDEMRVTARAQDLLRGPISTPANAVEPLLRLRVGVVGVGALDEDSLEIFSATLVPVDANGAACGDEFSLPLAHPRDDTATAVGLAKNLGRPLILTLAVEKP